MNHAPHGEGLKLNISESDNAQDLDLAREARFVDREGVLRVGRVRPAPRARLVERHRTEVGAHRTEERAEVAQVCMLRMNLEMPMLLDDMDDTAEKAYVAYPDRLYLIGTDGRVVYRSERGPVGFKVDDWAEAIKTLLSE